MHTVRKQISDLAHLGVPSGHQQLILTTTGSILAISWHASYRSQHERSTKSADICGALTLSCSSEFRHQSPTVQELTRLADYLLIGSCDEDCRDLSKEAQASNTDKPSAYCIPKRFCNPRDHRLQSNLDDRYNATTGTILRPRIDPVHLNSPL